MVELREPEERQSQVEMFEDDLNEAILGNTRTDEDSEENPEPLKEGEEVEDK